MFALAYNLANFLRQLVLPKSIRGWTLTPLREKLIKIGAKVMSHAKYVVFQLAEVAVPRSCSRRFWSGSAGCDWRKPRGEVCGDGQSGPKVLAVRPQCAARADFRSGAKEWRNVR